MKFIVCVFQCGLGGCLTELCIQLAIIMVGKQAMNTILEMILPIFYKWLNLVQVSRLIYENQSLVCLNSQTIPADIFVEASRLEYNTERWPSMAARSKISRMGAKESFFRIFGNGYGGAYHSFVIIKLG